MNLTPDIEPDFGDAPSHIPAPNGSTRVLFVDDDPLMRAMAGAILHSLGWQVFHAGSGEEATMLFKFCSQRDMPVAAVIMDIVMPGGMSGFATDRKSVV